MTMSRVVVASPIHLPSLVPILAAALIASMPKRQIGGPLWELGTWLSILVDSTTASM